MKKYVFIILIIFFSGQVLSETSKEMKIFIKKINIHAEKKEKVFYFQLKNNKLTSEKYKTNKNFNNLITQL